MCWSCEGMFAGISGLCGRCLLAPQALTSSGVGCVTLHSLCPGGASIGAAQHAVPPELSGVSWASMSRVGEGLLFVVCLLSALSVAACTDTAAAACVAMALVRRPLLGQLHVLHGQLHAAQATSFWVLVINSSSSCQYYNGLHVGLGQSAGVATQHVEGNSSH